MKVKNLIEIVREKQCCVFFDNKGEMLYKTYQNRIPKHLSEQEIYKIDINYNVYEYDSIRQEVMAGQTFLYIQLK